MQNGRPGIAHTGDRGGCALVYQCDELANRRRIKLNRS
jgi:hypothetical protein